MKKVFPKLKNLFSKIYHSYSLFIRILFLFFICFFVIFLFMIIKYIFIIIPIMKRIHPSSALNELNLSNLEIIFLNFIFSFFLFFIISFAILFFTNFLKKYTKFNHSYINKFSDFLINISFSISIVFMILSSFNSLQFSIFSSSISLFAILHSLKFKYSNLQSLFLKIIKKVIKDKNK